MKKKYRIEDKEWFENPDNWDGVSLKYWDKEALDLLGTIQEGVEDADGYVIINGYTYRPEEVEEVVEDAEVDFSVSSFSRTSLPATEYTDKHYDSWYTLTEDDIKRGKIKIDPYFVSKCIKLGSKDESCSLWHIFKTLFRWGEKNSIKREVKAVEGSLNRYKEVNGIE